jgi:hypothetical protein
MRNSLSLETGVLLHSHLRMTWYSMIPFSYFEEDGHSEVMEVKLLRTLTGPSGVLCHPHFGDGVPREIPGFRNVILEKYEAPPILMADGTHCRYAAAVLCYPVL